MKDQMQDKSRQAKEKAQEKAGQARQKAGQQGRQGRPGQPQRGTQNHRDIEDTPQQVQDRFDQDYDA
jgi:hypothetical protein